jgi:hypothetical protein
MDDRSESVGELPKYLYPLLEPRPSGEAKLLAAWDGLRVEHQILLLDSLGKHGRLDWTTKIRAKVLESPNPYVRYLAAKGFHASDRDSGEMTLKKRIEDDPELLVRYAPFEGEWTLLDRQLGREYFGPKTFFGLPQAARLAIVRSLCSMGKHVAEFIRYAIANELPNGRVTESELADIVLDYVTNPEFKSHYDPDNERGYDGWAEHDRGVDIEQLWMLVPDVPERVAVPLVCHLSERSGMSKGIPDAVLDAMTDVQRLLLFRRSDIGLRELRAEIFFERAPSQETAGSLKDDVRTSAISHNFSPTYAEFAEILAKPEKERMGILIDLLRYGCDLSPCIFQAVQDVLRETEWSEATGPRHSVWEETMGQRDRFDQKLAQLQGMGYSGEKLLYEWALYEWAKSAVPWKKGQEPDCGPEGDFEFLNKCVKAGDTWGTFMAFSQAWKAEASKRHSDACRKAMAQAVWQMVDADRDDERKKILQDLRVLESGTQTQQEMAKRYLTQSLTRGDFRLWVISLQKLGIEVLCGIVVIGIGSAAIWQAASNVYAGRYWTALSWLPVLSLCALGYWPFHSWYYGLDREQRRIRDVMSE